MLDISPFRIGDEDEKEAVAKLWYEAFNTIGELL
jgi:hypothetical protein